MARIPTISRPALRNLSQPGVAQVGASGVGSGIASLGREVEDIANRIVEKRTIAKEEDFVLSESESIELDIAEYKTKLDNQVDEKGVIMSTEGGDPDINALEGQTYADAIELFSSNRLEEGLSKAPTGRSQRKLDQFRRPVVNNEILKGRSYTRKLQANAYQNQWDKTSDNYALLQSKNPSAQDALRHIEETKDGISSTTAFTPEKAKSVSARNAEKIAVSFYEGLLRKDRALEAANMINKKDNQLNKEISADTMRALIAKVNRSVEIKNNKEIRRLADDVRSVTRVAFSTGATPQKRDIENLRSRQKRLRIDPEQSKVLSAQIEGLEKASQLLKDLPRVETDQLMNKYQEVAAQNASAVRDISKKGIVGSSKEILARDQTTSLLMKGMATHVNQRNKEFLDYATKHYSELQIDETLAIAGDPDHANRLREAKNVASNLGAPFKATTTKGRAMLASHIKTILTPSEKLSPQQRVAALDALEGSYQEFYPKAMSEVESQDDSLVGVAMVSHFSNPQTKAKMLDALTNKSQIKKAYKEQVSSSDRRDGSDILNAEMNDFYVTIRGARPEGLGALRAENSIREIANLMYQKNILEQGEDIDTEAAATKTANQIAGEWHIINSPNKSLLIPKRSIPEGISVSEIENKTDDVISFQGLKQLNLRIPESYSSQMEEVQNLLKESGIDSGVKGNVEDRFINDILSFTVAVPTDDQTGIKLYVESPEGTSPLFNKNGEPIELSYEEVLGIKIETTDPEQDEKLLRQVGVPGLGGL